MGEREALEQLRRKLGEHGVATCALRPMPDGLSLTVLVNLMVTHDGTDYRWREGRKEASHPGNDPGGAAAALASLARRLRVPAFQEAPEQLADDAP
ncbi:hypothetical protein [Actinomadura litoris]|uniref:Uncharacterized protein n=1 Tax=Actinomadura litoris TaxID=2678616 RepID=A0A7K1LBL9_9ACTN|nr:hypothetical protein [Actinomadura litoris]MUN41656.1 hypothetical protein [Actinomadura litoris]